MEKTDIYPLHPLDDLDLNRMPVHWLLHFDDVLDAQKLHDALYTLLENGDWRKVGGRLRKKGKKLEIYTSPYTTEHPPFAYHHNALTSSISEHPLASSLGRTHTPTQPLQDLRSLMVVPGSPTKFSQWLQNKPLLSILITTLTDATLIGISWPHSLMDASGMQALLQAWSQVLAGREPLPVLGAHIDVLAHPAQEKLILRKHMLKGYNKFEFMLRYVHRTIWRKAEVKRIYIPKAVLLKLREQASAGDNSVLTGWFTRIVASVEKKPVTQVAAMNARYRMKLDGVYLQNMILLMFTFLSEEDLSSLKKTTEAQQRQMDERATDQQTLALLDLCYSDYHAGRNVFLSLLSGMKNAAPVVYNNLTRLGITQAADFAPAVVGEKGTGKPSKYTIHHEPEKAASFLAITGKDEKGGYWLIASLQPKAWTKLEEELKALS